MAVESAPPRSRRAVLTGAFGVAVASIASALGRPAPVRADNGDQVIVGTSYTALTTTGFDTLGNNTVALKGNSNLTTGVWGSSGSGFGVRGTSSTNAAIYGSSTAAGQPAIAGRSNGDNTGVAGYTGTGSLPAAPVKTGLYGYAAQDELAHGVIGESPTGTGVTGSSTSGSGVFGQSFSGRGVWAFSNEGIGLIAYAPANYAIHSQSDSNVGVYGVNYSTTKPATVGHAHDHNTGVLGYSGATGEPPVSPMKTGVYGYAAQDANARGVTGESPTGQGVRGVTDSGRGVYGQAATGTGGYFATLDPATGFALRAVGRVKLDHCAGFAIIPATFSSIVVTPGIDLVSSSAVVATLQGSAGLATTTVSRVIVNTTANTFTIHLTAKTTVNVRVAWHVFG